MSYGVTPDVVCLRFEPLHKGTLCGAVDLRLYFEGGAWIGIRNYTLHERDGKRWVQGPVQSKGGKFAQLISWSSPAEQAAFQDAALRAIDRYIKEGDLNG